jgi:DNA polymerase-3 subunit delta'
MSWQGIEGHDDVAEQFRRCLAAGRLASTYLFVGNEGIGKRLFAHKLAQSLLCERRPEEALDPCGACPGCLQALAGTHPDVLTVAKPKDKSAIPLELLIGSGEKRMREGLCHDLGLKSFAGRRKIAIINDADFLNVEGANCLLKTLEEPPPRSLLILIGTSLERQLPTIRSRSQIVRFRPLEGEVVSRLLVERQMVADGAEARRLAAFCEGSLTRAAELADPELWRFRAELFALIAKSPLPGVQTARQVATFVDAAGSEAAARRQRLRQVIAFVVELLRAALRVQAGAAAPADEVLADAAWRMAHRAERDEDALPQAIETCLRAAAEVDRNVNLATVVDAWIGDLADTLRAAPVGG